MPATTSLGRNPWEAFLAEATLAAINQQRSQQDEAPFANARNACAGTLRQLDPQVVASRNVEFVAYGLHLSPEQPQPPRQRAVLQWLDAAGFKIDANACHCATLEEVERFYRHWNLQRHQLPYGTDGVVVKLDDLALQQQAGATRRAPRWAVAMKFSQVEARSTLRRLVPQVSRTGVVTPVAEFDPVALDGSTVARATLHNAAHMDEITQGEGLREGDVLVVRKAGGVIPQVVRVEPCSPPGNPLALPSHCPECQSLLVRESRQAALRQWLSDSANQHLLDRCPNLKASLLKAMAELEPEAATRCVNSSCPAILRGALSHWASRDALDVDGLGQERIEQLVEHGLVRTIEDLYGLQEADLVALEGWAAPLARSLLQSLETSKRQPWHRVLYGLGIPYVGSANAKVLAQASVEKLMNDFAMNRGFQGADEPLLESLTGIQKGLACKYQQWLGNSHNQALLMKREASGNPLERVFCIIPQVGLKRAKILTHVFPSVEDLVEAFAVTRQFEGDDKPLLEAYPDVDSTIAIALQQWLANPANQALLAGLARLGFQLHSQCPEATAAGPLTGQRFVLTGALPSLSRAEARKRIEAAGGAVTNSVSGKTTHLVVGDNPGSKLDKARSLGIAILDEEALLQRLHRQPQAPTLPNPLLARLQ